MQRLSAGSLYESDLGIGLGTPMDSASVCSSQTSDSGVSLGGGHQQGLRRMQFPRPVQIHHVTPEPVQSFRATPRPNPGHQNRPSSVHSSPPPPPSYASNHALSNRSNSQFAGRQIDYSLGPCKKCNNDIRSPTEACTALGKMYHNTCFTCSCCGRELTGETFYTLPGGAIYCAQDYLYTGFQQAAEKCASCGHVITEQILQALGRPFHPGCFRCSVCAACLDGEPFTVDLTGSVFCLPDYHRVYAPRCDQCRLPITSSSSSLTPAADNEEVLRIISEGRDFHLECYKCEDCRLPLFDDILCYPMVDETTPSKRMHLFCKKCRIRRQEILDACVEANSRRVF